MLLFTQLSSSNEGRSVQFNMLQAIPLYVQWPNEASRPAIRVCIVGARNPFEREIAANPNIIVRGKPLKFIFTTSIRELPPAEMYYFTLDNELICAGLAKKLDGKPVLRVSDHRRFSQRGGDIHFHQKNGRIVFEANRLAMKKQGLNVRSQLLRLSQPEDGR